MSLSTGRTEKSNALAQSLNLPVGVLGKSEHRMNTRPATNLYHSRLMQTISFLERRPQTTAKNNRKLIIRRNPDDKDESLSRRLRSLRQENKALESFSLSKLLSKVRVVSVDESSKQHASSGNTAPVPVRVPLKRFVRPKMYEFQKEKESPKERAAASTMQASTISTIAKEERYKKQQEQETSNIFRRYFCPSFTYRDPEYIKSIQPDKSFLINQWEHRIETKRIHNFYSSHMYKHGYQRHFTTSRKPSQETGANRSQRAMLK